MVLTIVLVIVLGKGGNNPPPAPDGPVFNPYEILAYNDSALYYKLQRNPSLAFDYPYNETLNNVLYDTIVVQGTNVQTDNPNTLRLQFG